MLLVCALLACLGTAGGPVGAGAAARAAGPRGSGRPTVLLYGDSVALTFGLALEVYASVTRGAATVIDDGQLGCGVAEGSDVIVQGQPTIVPATCNPATPASGQWPAILARAVAVHRPQVVALLAGRWELFDRTDAAGQVTDIMHPAYAAYVEGQLQEFVAIASERGAHVVLMTTPYYQPTSAPAGPEDDPARVDEYNRLVRQVVRDHPHSTSLFRLNALVSPHGRYSGTVGSQMVRASDGVHFPFFLLFNPTVSEPDNFFQVLQFSRWLGPRVLPSLVRSGR